MAPLKTLAVACALLAAFITSPARAKPPLLVAAASSMKFVFEDLLPAFHAAHPGTEVRLAFGSSGNFYAQISHGAPFDIFFSADMDYPEKLGPHALSGETAVPYAAGRLVLWTPHSTGLDPRTKKLNLLLDPRVRKIAIANPRHAPYGRAAIQVLKKSGLHERVLAKLIQGENITQAAQFVHTGAAEAGLIALSLARTEKMMALGTYWKIPEANHDAIRQGCLLLKNGKNPEAARAFLSFLTGEAGQKALARYGFRPLAGASP